MLTWYERGLLKIQELQESGLLEERSKRKGASVRKKIDHKVRAQTGQSDGSKSATKEAHAEVREKNREEKLDHETKPDSTKSIKSSRAKTPKKSYNDLSTTVQNEKLSKAVSKAMANGVGSPVLNKRMSGVYRNDPNQFGFDPNAQGRKAYDLHYAAQNYDDSKVKFPGRTQASTQPINSIANIGAGMAQTELAKKQEIEAIRRAQAKKRQEELENRRNQERIMANKRARAEQAARLRAQKDTNIGGTIGGGLTGAALGAGLGALGADYFDPDLMDAAVLGGGALGAGAGAYGGRQLAQQIGPNQGLVDQYNTNYLQKMNLAQPLR